MAAPKFAANLQEGDPSSTDGAFAAWAKSKGLDPAHPTTMAAWNTLKQRPQTPQEKDIEAGVAGASAQPQRDRYGRQIHTEAGREILTGGRFSGLTRDQAFDTSRGQGGVSTIRMGEGRAGANFKGMGQPLAESLGPKPPDHPERFKVALAQHEANPLMQSFGKGQDEFAAKMNPAPVDLSAAPASNAQAVLAQTEPGSPEAGAANEDADLEREARRAKVADRAEAEGVKPQDFVAQRAKGGPVKAGKPYLVGEKGPEIVIPRKAGTVIPAKKTKQAMRAAPSNRSKMLAAMAAGKRGMKKH